MAAYVSNIGRAPITLTEREQRQLLSATGLRHDGYRDHMIFALALATALREHELLALNVEDIFDDGGKARRRVQLHVYKRSNTNVEAQQILLSEQLRAKLEKFYTWKRRKGEAVSPEAPLFTSRNRNRLATRTLRHAFQVWQKRAGLERSFRFHSLRHCAISRIYEQTKDILVAQRFARHSSIASTQIYTHPSDESMRRAVQDLLC